MSKIGGPSKNFKTVTKEIKPKLEPMTLGEKYETIRKPMLDKKMQRYDVRQYEKDGEVQSITICLRK